MIIGSVVHKNYHAITVNQLVVILTDFRPSILPKTCLSFEVIDKDLPRYLFELIIKFHKIGTINYSPKLKKGVKFELS